MSIDTCKSLNEITISDQNVIFDKKSGIYVCNICNCSIFGKVNANLHIQGKPHNIMIKSNKSSTLIKNDFKTHLIKVYYCSICKMFMTNIKMLQCHTMFHLYDKLNIPSENDIILFKSEATKQILKCLLCNIFFSNFTHLSNHLESSLHLNRLIIFSCIKDDIELDGFRNVEVDINNYKNIEFELNMHNFDASLCTVCDLAMLDGNIIEHINGKRHINSLKKFETKISESQETNLIINTSSLYVCFICKKSFSTVIQLLKHYQESDHKKIIKCFLTIYNNVHLNFINFGNKEIIQCSLCNINMYKSKNVIEHILGKKHNIQLKLFYLKQSDELNNKISKLYLNTKNICFESSECIIEKLSGKEDDLVEINYHKLNEKRDKKNQCGKIFIKYCIDSGTSNIYNINEEKIDLIKFGFTLIFPLQQINKFICLSCDKHVLNKQLLFEHLQNIEHINILKQLKDKDEMKKYNTLIDLYIKNKKHVFNCELWKKQSAQILEEFLMIFHNSWYYAQVYICSVCQKKFDLEIRFVEHLIGFTHLKNVNCMKSNGTILEFHICPVCVTYWYGKFDSYKLHCENSFHKYFVEHGDLMVPKMSKFIIDLLNNIDKNMDILLNESNKISLEFSKEFEVLKAIEKTIKCMYSNAKSYLFGSRLSCIGLSDSDLDIFLDCDNLYYKCNSKSNMEKYLVSVTKYFQKDSNTWIINEIILDTKVPIIKLRHMPTGIKTDISFLNGLSVEKSKLIRYYNDAYFICRNLMLYLKKWIVLSQIPGSRGIPTYAISWYVIFYLQIKGIFPSVFEVIKLENKSKIIDGWECGFYEKISAKNSDLSFKDHIKEFFYYYADFDYKLNVICPYLGKIIKKNSFISSEKLPTEMKIYKQKITKNQSSLFKFDSPMCIQDPIDLSQNITKHITKLQLQCFRKYCYESATKISQSYNYEI